MLPRSCLPAIIAVLALTPLSQAAPTTIPLHTSLNEPLFKVNHGFVIAFTGQQGTRGHNAIEVFDREGRRVAGVDVLGQLPEAAEITLGDVAVRDGGAVVVNVEVRKENRSVEDRLLYFAWDGRLEHSLALSAEQEINRLDLDESGNVWTLADYFGRKEDDSTGPLIYIYDREGKMVKGLLRRTDYPEGFKEGGGLGGATGFGLTGDGFWFWQPVRHRLTIASRDGRVLSQKVMEVSKSHGGKGSYLPPQFSLVALLASGDVAAAIACPCVPGAPAGAYVSQGSHLIPGPSRTEPLIGVDSADLIFLKRDETGAGQYEIIRQPS